MKVGGPPTVIDSALEYLRQTQSVDGSWNSSSFQTASVLRALVPASLPNLAMDPSDMVLSPDPPEIGQSVQIQVTVHNRSRAPSGAFRVHLYDGPPSSGGFVIDTPAEVPTIDPGSAISITFDWNTSGLEGAHELCALADPEAAVTEVTESDNTISRSVEVLPSMPNLVVGPLRVSPENPAEGLGAVLQTRVTNQGSAEAPSSLVRFRDGPLALERILDEVSIPALAPGEGIDVEGNWDTTGVEGHRKIEVKADALDEIPESNERDNEVGTWIDVRERPPEEPDLVLGSDALTIDPAALHSVPMDVTVGARIRNTGLTSVTSVRVELFQGDPSSGGLLIQEQITDVPGDGAANVTFQFNVANVGTRAYFVVVDRDNVVGERDELNNLASVVLVDLEDTVEVELVASSLVLSEPSVTAGDTVSVAVDVVNRGTRPLPAVPIALVAVDPADAQPALASSLNVSLEAGASTRVELNWVANRIGDIELGVQADPYNALEELDESNNEATAIVEVLASDLPNLVVESAGIQLSPEPVLEGQPVMLEARVRNVGAVSAPSVDISFYAGDPEQDGWLIGGAPAPALEPDTDAIIQVSWDEVAVRGGSLFFAVADPDHSVDEFDEEDNLAFKVVDVLGLSDLMASSAQIGLDPPYARSGETVTIHGALTNTGEQEASDFSVELRVDDPVSGDIVTSETVSTLPAGETYTFEGTWDTTGIDGEHHLLLVLDVSNAVREQNEGNNVVAIPVAIQDADVFVSPLYFSPNGDGIQDETAFFFRTDGEQDLEVNIVDRDQAFVRKLDVAAATSGSVLWDGRDEAGALAPDGAYFFVLESANGEVTRRRVVLDTNRSNVVEALGTPYLAVDNLTCPLPQSSTYLRGPAWFPDDSGALFIVRRLDSGAPEYAVGLYRVSPDGTAIDAIAAGSEFAQLQFHEEGRRAVSLDGLKVLVERSRGRNVAVFDLASGSSAAIGQGSTQASWSPDGKRLLVRDDSGLSIQSAEGEELQRLSDEYVNTASWSADGLRIAYHREGEYALRIVNADGTNDRLLPETNVHDLTGSSDHPCARVEEILWSRDPSEFYFTWAYLESYCEGANGYEVSLSSGEIRNVGYRRNVSYDRRWSLVSDYELDYYVARRVEGRQMRLVLPTSEGYDFNWSSRDTRISFERRDSLPECLGDDVWTLSSLLNGFVDLRLTRLPSSFGVRVTGTVADLNMDHYSLEYATVDQPESFIPVQPPSAVPVVGDLLTTWIPPAANDYLVRLTLRDRAGNESVRLERIYWAETLPIASLARKPELISPNGDGVQDETVVSYTVLEPVNLEFHVRDGDGRVVRTLLRDEMTVGQVSFAWDGRDDLGRLVPDGTYTLEIRGAELPVVVDITPPDVAAHFSDLYTSSTNPLKAALAVDLEGRIQDANLKEWVLLSLDGEMLESGLNEVGSGDDSDLVILENLRPQPGTEIHASDYAGNRTAIPLAGPGQELRLLGQMEIGAMTLPVRAFGPFSPGPADQVAEIVLSPLSMKSYAFNGILMELPPRPATAVFTASASFPTNDLVFRYREVNADSYEEIPTPSGKVKLPVSDLDFGASYEAHFAAGDVRSQTLPLVVGPNAILLEVESYFVEVYGETYKRYAVHGLNTVEEPVVEATLYVIADGVQTTLQTFRPLPKDFAVNVGAGPCDNVSYSVVGIGESGQEYLSTTREKYPEPYPAGFIYSGFGPPRCLFLRDAGIERQECGEPAPTRAAFRLDGEGVSAPVLAVSDETGREVARGTDAELAWDVSGLAEGNHSFIAQAFWEDGTVTESNRLSFYVDPNPPRVAIDFPPSGGNACVVTVGKSEYVELSVEAFAKEIWAYRIERLNEEGIWEAVSIKPQEPLIEPPIEDALLQRVLVGIPEEYEGNLSLRLVVESSRFSDETNGKQWPHGPNDVNNGTLSSCIQHEVIIVRSQALGALSSEPEPSSPYSLSVFSPDGDGQLDQLHVSGELRQPAAITARVFPSGISTAVRTVVEDTSFSAGIMEILWDGRDDTNQTVPDGKYQIVVDAIGGCGSLETQSLTVEVDTTPPVVGLEAPTVGDSVATSVQIFGTATDDHFLEYVVEVGEGDSPVTFTSIVGPTAKEVESGLLGIWNVDESTGLHVLKLTARDKAGNSSSTEVLVTAVTPDLLGRLSAEPTLFSPNADGVMDTAEITLQLKAEARVTLEIRREDDSSVARLIEDQVLAAGEHRFPWDGEGTAGVVDDDNYAVVAVAVDAINGSVSEEVSVPLSVDTTPPTQTVDDFESGAFIRLPRELFGSIADEHLERYELLLGPELGELLPVNQGSRPLVGSLVELPALEDGNYRLRLNALDLAGNVSELERSFTVDNTPPTVSLTAPDDGAFLATSSSPISIGGSLVEQNVESYALEIGIGAVPRGWMALAGGNTLESESIAVDWEVNGLPDSVYSIRLTATDLAGNTATTSRPITLDGAPPVVAIAEPSEGAFVTEPVAVVGAVRDEHLETGLLSISPGGADTAFQFTELSRLAEPIQNGELHSGVNVEDGIYTLKLTATDRAGNTTELLRSYQVDTAPPGVPTTLMAEIERPSDVRLSWEPVSDPDLAGYVLYRDGARLNQEPITSTEYLDANRREGRFLYTVKAVDLAGLESESSNPADVAIDLTPPNVALIAPADASRIQGLVDIVGTAFSENDFDSYRLSVAPANAPSSKTVLKQSNAPASFSTIHQWDCTLLDGELILTLEAEDTHGNAASVETRVTVDNVAPSAPVLISAEAVAGSDDVEVIWGTIDDTDVRGYLVYRNGQVANAPGTVAGALSPYLITGSSYVDEGLPDGRHCYRIVAMDEAGNLGPDSNEICTLLDNRAPAAIIFDPSNGDRFDKPRQIRAVTEDEDVVSVLFQFRQEQQSLWTDIGTDTESLFEILWDVTGLDFGGYELRAVATDSGSRSDSNPANINVTLGDATPPAVPLDLLTRVTGATVAVSWEPVADGDLAGYRLYRNDEIVGTIDPSVTTYEEDLPDGIYEYEVATVDSESNESARSEPSRARVYAPQLDHLFPIHTGATVTMTGSNVEPEATVRLTDVGTGETLREVVAGHDGRFAFSDLALPDGWVTLVAGAADAEGNESRPSEEAVLIRNYLPAAPTDFAGTTTDTTAELSWSADTDPDIAGYHLRRDSERVNLEKNIDLAELSATASSYSYYPPGNAVDGNEYSSWRSSAYPFTPQWIEIEISSPLNVREISVRWGGSYYVGKDYRILAELNGRMVPVAVVWDNTAYDSNRHRFPTSFQTGRIRIEIASLQREYSNYVAIGEITLIDENPIAGNTFSDTPPDLGQHQYTLTAMDSLGGESPATDPLELTVGDFVAPEPPINLVASVDMADVQLIWTAGPSSDVVSYRILRDGELVDEVGSTDYLDMGVQNGLHLYQVLAVDDGSNESVPSNEAEALVDVALPDAPTNLVVSTIETGSALDLTWSASGGPHGVEGYVVLRSMASGGPYEEIDAAPSAAFRDEGLENGVEYFYVVRTVDSHGNESENSNEAGGIPNDQVSPATPELVFPASPGRPAHISSFRTTLIGVAEPSSTVTVFRETEEIGSVEPEMETRELNRFALPPVDGLPPATGISKSAPEVAIVGTTETQIIDLVRGVIRTIPTDILDNVMGVAFSPSGSRLAVAAVDLLIFDISTSAVERFDAGGAGWPAWLSDDVVAFAVGRELRSLDLATGEASTLHAALSYYAWIDGISPSPDGSRVAFVESGALKLIDPLSGDVTTLSDNYYGSNHTWSHDGHFYYSTAEGLTDLDPVAGSSVLIPDTEDVVYPRVTPEDRVSFLRRRDEFYDLYLMDPASFDVEVAGLLGVESWNVELVEWSSDLRLVIGDGSTLELLTYVLSGRFELPFVDLVAGTNTLHATATDAAGNPSDPSMPVEIIVDVSQLPDLVPATLTVVPAVPSTGQTASITAMVRNEGAADAGPVLMRATAVDASGRLFTIGTSSLPAIAAGSSASASVAWDTTDRVGPYDVLVDVDPMQSLEEVDETNNRISSSVTVVGTAGIDLIVATGLSSYGLNQDVQISIVAVNGGLARNLRFETSIEDTSGRLVAPVDTRQSALGYGGGRNYQVFWNTGTTLAGDYTVRARVFDADSEVATGSTSFTIRKVVGLATSVIAGRASYSQGASIDLLGRVANTGGNAVLRNLIARFRTVDDIGNLVFEASESVAYLARGGSVSPSAHFFGMDLEPGPYGILLDVLDDGVTLDSATSSVEIVAASGPELAGSLTPDVHTVPLGAEVVAGFELTNIGVVPLSGGVAQVEMMDPATGELVRSAEVPVDVAAGAEITAEIHLPTDGLSYGGWVLLLYAGPVGELEPIDSGEVFLFGVPSTPSLNYPADGESTGEPLILSANNSSSPNGVALTYTFEIYLDEALQFRIAAASGITEGANVTNWEIPVVLNENRSYTWRAMAGDRYAVSEWMSPATLFLDTLNEAPSRPILSSPAEASVVSVLQPMLEIGNAVDPENQPLQYTFEIYRDEVLDAPSISIGPVPGGDGRTAVPVPEELEEDRTYVWRARAHDGELDGPWMVPASFRVNTANHGPNAPTTLTPVGESPQEETPELVVGPAVDPEDDPLTYAFEIDRNNRFDSPERQFVEGVEVGIDDVRWRVVEPLVENQNYFWRARATDGHVVGDWSEVAAFRQNLVNEPPTIPTLQSPTGGTFVRTATPALTLINSTDPEEDLLTYEIEVYADQELIELVAGVDRLREGESQTSWVASPRLEEDVTYYWRGRAHDGGLAGDWSFIESLRVNAMNREPGTPALDSPADGSRLTDPEPVLTVVNTTDPDGDPLVYRFELYEDEFLTSLLVSEEVGEQTDRTSWQNTAALVENEIFFWRVRASDGELHGSWMPTARFRFSAFNEEPGPPVALSPDDGSELTEPMPVLGAENAVDPDGDTLQYVFRVFADPDGATLVLESDPVDEGDGVTAWRVTAPLEENGTFCWEVVATDGLLEGPPSERLHFRVNAVHDPPSIPIPILPGDGSEVGGMNVNLVVTNAESPDGYGLHYHFEIYRDESLTDLVADDPYVNEGQNSTVWSVPLQLTPGETYFWRVRAVDEEEVAGEWSEVWRFTVKIATSECPPEWSEDFEGFATGMSPEGWELRKEFGWPAFRVERDQQGEAELRSIFTGRGALHFVGSGESAGWGNYEFRGEFNQPSSFSHGLESAEQDSTQIGTHCIKPECFFRSGVIFYADRAEGTEYRLELTGPWCMKPQARLIKVKGDQTAVLAETSLSSSHGLTKPIFFHVQVLNQPDETALQIRLWSFAKKRRGKEQLREWWLQAVDSEEPLRAGTVGVWSNFYHAGWDNLLVRALPGLDSGISGDENGNGVCDIDEVDIGPIEACLDEDFDPKKGTSLWITGVEGKTGHSGPGQCGAKHSYWVSHKDGALHAQTPELEGGSYRFQLLLGRHLRQQPRIKVIFPSGEFYALRPQGEWNPKGPKRFVWSQPITVTLPSGVSTFRILSVVKERVQVEAFRLEPLLEP